MPSSIVRLSVLDKSIHGEAEIPLIELANAVGDQRVTNFNDPFFNTYLSNHIKVTAAGTHWSTQVESLTVLTDKDPIALVGGWQ